MTASKRVGLAGIRKRYDFSKARPSSYAQRLTKEIVIRLDIPTLEYFKDLSAQVGVPYQTLINLYLQECAWMGKRLSLTWANRRRRRT